MLEAQMTQVVPEATNGVSVRIAANFTIEPMEEFLAEANAKRDQSESRK